MHNYTVALFGEAERGAFQKAYVCDSLQQLIDCLGNPPAHSRGLAMAIQALLYDRQLIFFRVEEEGFSLRDYYSGLHHLGKGGLFKTLAAVGMPGVGDTELITASQQICQLYHSILLTTESDLYDFLTNQAA